MEQFIPALTPDIPTLSNLVSTDVEGIDLSNLVDRALRVSSGVIKPLLINGQGFACIPINSRGEVCGHGICLFPNGTQIEGTWSRGGEGQMMLDKIQNAKVSSENGECLMTGDVVDGKLCGCECEISSLGGKYRGQVVNGNPHGDGTFSRPDGTWYTGEWINGQREGRGIENFSESNRYNGQWFQDLYHGDGVLYMPGRQYSGTWRNGIRTGKGQLTEVITGTQTFEVEYDDHGNEIQRQTLEVAEINRLKRQIEENAARPPSPPSSPLNASEPLCKVCLESPVTRVLQPCRHACLCLRCEDRLREQMGNNNRTTVSRIRCPMCRNLCRNSEEIILS